MLGTHSNNMLLLIQKLIHTKINNRHEVAFSYSFMYEDRDAEAAANCNFMSAYWYNRGRVWSRMTML